MRSVAVFFLLLVLSSFRLPMKKICRPVFLPPVRPMSIPVNKPDTAINNIDELAQEFVDYAKTLIGTRYVWGSVNPEVGVDCSGFVNYVSRHFGMSVPRTAAQFTHVGMEVACADARAGDIILFKGRNLKRRKVGHMGIVTDNPDGDLHFIHSSSGHRRGVHISELKGYYKTRFVKIIRIFPLADDRVVG